jgi:hypothetical protein
MSGWTGCSCGVRAIPRNLASTSCSSRSSCLKKEGGQDVRMDGMQPWRDSNFQEPCINILSIPFILSKEGGKTG